jgi:hypothetical protein
MRSLWHSNAFPRAIENMMSALSSTLSLCSVMVAPYGVLCFHVFWLSGSFLLKACVLSACQWSTRPFHDSPKLFYTRSPSHLYTHNAMAPRKKAEEKATANEAADMVLHYLRKPCISTLSEGVIRVSMACDLLMNFRQAESTIFSNRCLCKSTQQGH